MSADNKLSPLVTVVTVVFNGETCLEETILSVVNQTYKNIEYILIDGDSTDKTLEIIKRYKSHIYYWISEKDFGIYDAMNKGIDIATGEWICFMNAGDTFSSKSSIEEVFSLDQSRFTVIYGDVEVSYTNFKRLVRAKKISEIPKGMPFCHQSTLVKTAYHKSNKFNLVNSIAADMEFLMSAFRSGCLFNYVPFAISKVSSGGVSDTKRMRTILAWWRVSYELGAPKSLAFHYITLLSITYFKSVVKFFLPDALVMKLLKCNQ